MPEVYENFIGGEWTVSDSGTFDNRNPADITDLISEFQYSAREDAERAVSEAVNARNDWAATLGPSAVGS